MAETLDNYGYPCNPRKTKNGWFYIERTGITVCIRSESRGTTVCETIPWRQILAATVYAPPVKPKKPKLRR